MDASKQFHKFSKESLDFIDRCSSIVANEVIAYVVPHESIDDIMSLLREHEEKL